MRLTHHGRVVLHYQRINEADDPFFPSAAPALFEWQLRFLAARFAIVPLDTLLDAEPDEGGRPLAALTFDDGYRDFHQHAYPILRHHGLPATLFLVAGCLDDRDFLWTDKVAVMVKLTAARALSLAAPVRLEFPLRSIEERVEAAAGVKAALKRAGDDVRRAALDALQAHLDVTDFDALQGTMLRARDVLEMLPHGITVGSHTMTHPILTRLPLARAADEIARSRAALEALVGRPMSTFCYPNGLPGDVNEPVADLVRQAGYRLACTSMAGVNHRGSDPWRLRRVPFSRRVLGSLPLRMAGELRRLVGVEFTEGRIWRSIW